MLNRESSRIDRRSAQFLAADPNLVPYGLDRHRRAGRPVTEGSELTHRGWTRLGTITGSSPALVDPRGLVVPHESSWSVDWWIGADDRWYHPAVEGAVAQDLVEESPVVTTTMKVPGGEIVHSVGAVRHRSDDVLLVEITNEGTVPVALALAVIPYGAVGPIPVEHITLDDTQVVVDGNLAVRLSRPPARSVAGSWIEGDVVDTVVNGEAGAGPIDHHDANGAGSAVFILPLSHGTTQRVVLPVGHRPRTRRVGWRRRETNDELPAVTDLPGLERVAAGWASLADGGTRIVAPDPLLGRALAAGRGHLLRAAADLRIDGQPTSEAALVAEALGRLGHRDEAFEILVEVSGRQRPDGSWGDTSTTEAVVAALGGQLARGSAFDQGADEWAAVLAAGATHLARAGCGGRAVGIGLAGLRRIGQTGAADMVAANMVGTEESSDREPVEDEPDADGFGSRLAEAQWVSRLVETRAPEAFMALSDLLQAASATMTWPASERTEGVRLARGEGHSAAVQALAVGAVLDLMVGESVDGLDLFPVRPEGWDRSGVEVHDVPTRWGCVSAAVRWHGERPALLWSVDDPRPGLVLRASALDPAWAATDTTGETLLG